ncbi:MAG: efflux RND transporter periplasmic adaptor subunit [Gammaproteobacteria bacterium]|nr:efflux RND transporter periplasmic adaptor subunit [Gammaproteobacteria bacterium]
MRLKSIFGDNTPMVMIFKPGASLALVLVLSWLAAAPVGAQQALVTVDPVLRQEFTQTLPILGRLAAVQAGTVAARVAGAVTRLDVRVGDSLAPGQAIATIDPEPLRLQKKLLQNQLKEAEARIGVVQAQLALARQDVDRLSNLTPSSAVSQSQIDNAIQQENIAFARVREAETAVNSAKAQIHLIDLELSYTRITAPYHGTVTEKLTEVGSYLQRGQAVVRLVSDSALEVEADIPAVRLEGLAVGRIVEVAFENDDRYEARVRAVVPEENPRTRTRRVRFSLDIDSAALALAAEQSVTVMIPAGANREISSVHKDAVIRKGRASIVYVVKEGLAKLRPVRLGPPVGNRLEVLEGLAEGELVVIRGNERLQPDQPVQVMENPS